MKTAARVGSKSALFAWLVVICAPAAGPSQSSLHHLDTDVIFTAAPVYHPLAALHSQDRFPQGAQLFLLHEGKAQPLVPGFAAAADADLSFDAKSILFAGKQRAGDPWQVWELRLADRKLRKIGVGSADEIRPLYLPGGRFVSAHRTERGLQIVAAKLDGSGSLALTYMNAGALPETVLHDGRILFQAGYPLGSGATPEMFLVYQDGSGVESYRCDHGAARWGGRQLLSGDIVFTHGSSLARFTSPLAHEASIAAPHAEYAGGIAETANGDWLVSARTAGAPHYSLKLMKLPGPGSTASPMTALFAQSGVDLVEPVLVAPRTRPNIHPTALHPWSYANLLALDARQSRDGALSRPPALVQLETLGQDGRAVPMGQAPVEPDGSFFVQVPADQPVRFTLLDDKGTVLKREQGWFWIRRGEQRYCVGCHVGPEHAPENHMPQVLQRSTTAVNLTGSPNASAPAAGGK